MRQMIYRLVRHEIPQKTVYFIYHFNVCFSRNWRKCSQSLERWNWKFIENAKFMRQMIYHLVGHICNTEQNAVFF